MIAIILFLLFCPLLTHAQYQGEYGVGQADQVTKGLVGYWSMRNSGSTAFVEAGIWTNNATAYNYVFSKTYGVVGNGLLSNGNNTKVVLGSSTTLGFAGDMTVSFWAKRTDAAAGNYFIANWAGPATFNWAFLTETSGKIRYTNGPKAIDSRVSILNAWHHFVGTRDGTTGRLYIDGVQNWNVGITGNTGMANTVAVNVGLHVVSLGGYIDEVRIYNRHLSDEEIEQLYRMGSVRDS